MMAMARVRREAWLALALLVAACGQAFPADVPSGDHVELPAYDAGKPHADASSGVLEEKATLIPDAAADSGPIGGSRPVTIHVPPSYRADHAVPLA